MQTNKTKKTRSTKNQSSHISFLLPYKRSVEKDRERHQKIISDLDEELIYFNREVKKMKTAFKKHVVNPFEKQQKNSSKRHPESNNRQVVIDLMQEMTGRLAELSYKSAGVFALKRL